MRVLLVLIACLLSGCTYPFLGAPPGIGYLDHGDYVSPDGRRTELPRTFERTGISGIAPYDGGFLVADDRYFEGSVGLWFVRDGRARELPGCSAGSPRRVAGWVWWITASCPESLDFRRARIHRARPDGTSHQVRLVRSNGSALFDAARALDRLAPVPRKVREDSRHRLTIVIRRGLIAIVRIGADGSRELATEPARFNGFRPAYVLGPGR